jgi:16S rRNA (cytidine1402-2'-O)-methyltransferase
MAGGASAALLTDAGTPVVSDPGTELIDACVERGIEVDAIPGPSAVTTALALSGFYGQRWAFLGYPPRKPGPVKELLAPYGDSPMTLVLFESPHRVGKLLAVCADVLGERRYAVCRELTKAHQQVWRSRLPQVPSEADVPQKGEVTLVVEGRRNRKGAEARV